MDSHSCQRLNFDNEPLTLLTLNLITIDLNGGGGQGRAKIAVRPPAPMAQCTEKHHNTTFTDNQL